MINWSCKHIALIAVFFFAAFVGVFTTNALCDLEIIEYAPNLAHIHEEESTDSHHNDSHKHHNSESNGANSQEDDPCCKDVTSQLETSLFNKIIKHKTVEAKYFLMGGIALSAKLVSLFQPINILYHEFDDPPPLDGFSIRVLIQSFLN